MIVHSYKMLNTFLLFIITLVVTVIFVLSRQETLQYLADTYVKNQLIGYDRIEGSFLSGITLHNVTFEEAVTIKTLEVHFNIPMLLLPTPRITSIMIDGVRLIPGNFSENDSNNSEISLPAFSIASLSLTELTIITDEKITLDLHAEDITINDHLDIETVAIKLSTSYADLTAHGHMKTNTLFVNTSVKSKKTLRKIIHPLQLPPDINISLIADMKNIRLSTQLDRLTFADDENLSVRAIALDLNYSIAYNYFMFDTQYDLVYQDIETAIVQKGLFTLDGAYSFKIEGCLIKHSLYLPFEKFSAEAAGDAEAIVAKVDAGPLLFFAQSENYTHFSLHSSSPALSLSFYPEIPDLFQGNIIAYDTNATLVTSPFSLKGTLFTEGNNTTFAGNFDINEESMLYKAQMHPKLNSPLLRDYPIDKISPMKVVYYHYQNSDLLNIDANMLNLTLFKNRTTLDGWGNLATTTFSAKGDIEADGDMNLTLNSSTPSLYALALEMVDFKLGNYEFYDAQLDINATLNLSDTLKVNGSVNLPWYVGQTDSQTHYFGEDLFFEASAEDEQLEIERYGLDIMQHTLYSDRPSQFSVDENSTVHLESFWIFDNLLLTGSFNPLSQTGRLNFSGDHVRYEGVEGNISAEVNITATFEENLTQTIEGNIHILEGIITYAPHNNYSILDEDIIIIQDVKPPSKTARSINIAITGKTPITYEYESIKIKLTPDFTLYQEPFKPLLLLGMLHVDGGEINAGDKHFEVQEGDIYLQGDTPINPYLNLHLKYTTIDYIDIGIAVANTLNEPVIIFTSSPPMSQNDILSYLLFGGPATSTFESSGDETTTASVGAMLLGTGLKTIFTDTTGIQVDTLNILTNKEGSLGYEIGARFSKEIRIVYKNDTISSIILQYSISKSVRIDVDIHETGQGINLLYIKDF